MNIIKIYKGYNTNTLDRILFEHNNSLFVLSTNNMQILSQHHAESFVKKHLSSIIPFYNCIKVNELEKHHFLNKADEQDCIQYQKLFHREYKLNRILKQ